MPRKLLSKDIFPELSEISAAFSYDADLKSENLKAVRAPRKNLVPSWPHEEHFIDLNVRPNK